MLTSFKKKYLSNIAFIFLILISFLFLLKSTPNTGYDSDSYIHFSAIRPPVYPLFISLFQWAGSHQFMCVMWAQSMLTLFALYYSKKKFEYSMGISPFLIFFAILFTLITICFHFQFRYIESEGLSFPFFIFAFFACLNAFKQYSLKNIIVFSLWVSILILTRLQFYFFYGVFLLLLLWYIKRKVAGKSILKTIIIFIASIMITALLDHTYHFIKNDRFSSEPISGVQFAIQPLFLASANAETLFSDPTISNVVKKIQTGLIQTKLNQDAQLLSQFKLQHYEYAYQEYNRNYVAIQQIIYSVFSNVSTTEENSITNKIAKTLFMHDMKKNIFFYAWKVIDAFGGIPNFLFFVLFLPAILLATQKEMDMVSLFVSLSVITMFANALLVATAETNCPPYFCYTQFLLYLLSALFADRIFFHEKK